MLEIEEKAIEYHGNDADLAHCFWHDSGLHVALYGEPSHAIAVYHVRDDGEGAQFSNADDADARESLDQYHRAQIEASVMLDRVRAKFGLNGLFAMQAIVDDELSSEE